MEFQQVEYLIANYQEGNQLMQPTEIPWFAFDFTLLASSTVWLQTLNMDADNGEFNFIDFVELDNAKLNANHFEGYNTIADNIGFCRLAFKDGTNTIYKVSNELFKFSKGANFLNMEVINGWFPVPTTTAVQNDSEILLGVIGNIKIGFGLKFKLTGDSNYYYAYVHSIVGNSMFIYGAPFTSAIEELFYCSQDFISLIDFTISDESFSVVDADILNDYNNQSIEMQTGALVYFKAKCKTEDTGQKAQLSVRNDFDLLKTIDLETSYNGSGVTINTGYYIYTAGDNLRLDVPDVGANIMTSGVSFKAIQVVTL